MASEKYLEDAYRYAVKNAYLHNGKADLGAVVSKIAALHKGINVKEIIPALKEEVGKVNKLSFAEIEKEYKKFEGSYELKPVEKEKGLPKLEWADKERVITRYAPNPNGPFHLGNARAAILSAEYAKMYKGEFYLRFDDTDPKVKKPVENAENLFREDLKWLGYVPDKVFFASDRLDLYYEYMRKIIEMGKAYVCSCDSEKWKKLVDKGKACKCRDLKPKEQLENFEKMLRNEIKEEEAVLRIKTDLKDKDPSVRDWWAAKCVDNPKHPNPKTIGKHVWPSYNFASAIDDHELGITLIIRGQEHEQNQTKQEFLYKYFGWNYPHSIHFGRIKLEGMMLSTSKTKAGIDSGLYTGWDDPRLGTIKALRRRGFDARALVEAIIEVGIRPNDASISASKLADLNKKYIDSESKRIAFIKDPLYLDVHFVPEAEVSKDSVLIKLNKGQERFAVSREELDKIKEGTTIRLRNLYNARITKKDAYQAFAEYMGDIKLDKNIISWIKNPKDVEIVMPDNSRIQGIIENIPVKKGDRFYLEKTGYAIADSCEKEKVVLYLSHK